MVKTFYHLSNIVSFWSGYKTSLTVLPMLQRILWIILWKRFTATCIANCKRSLINTYSARVMEKRLLLKMVSWRKGASA